MNQPRWQPVIMCLNRRLECKCGALGIFVSGKISDNSDKYNILEEVDVWCQNCFVEAQEEERD